MKPAIPAHAGNRLLLRVELLALHRHSRACGNPVRPVARIKHSPIQRTHHPEPFRTGRDLQVDLGCCDVFVAENLLDGSQIGRRSEQVGCERVPQRMARHALLDPRRPCHAFDRFVLDLLVEVMTAPEGAFGIDR